jgi:hypothetical protein
LGGPFNNFFFPFAFRFSLPGLASHGFVLLGLPRQPCRKAKILLGNYVGPPCKSVKKRCKSVKNIRHANANTNLAIDTHRFSVIELASFVDLTPWHRFGFSTANAAILEAVEGYSVIHIVDLSLTHCMQIPTLIDAIASRHEVLPLLKLIVAAAEDDIPPMLELSYKELGLKLVNFVRSKNVMMEFRVSPSGYKDGFATLIEQLRMQQHLVYSESGGGEALVVNCHMMLHYILEESFESCYAFESSSLEQCFWNRFGA